MPDTYTIDYEDIDGKTYEIPIGVGTKKELIPHVIQGYIKTVKARAQNADILKAQAAKYPTSAEQGGAPGSVTEAPDLVGAGIKSGIAAAGLGSLPSSLQDAISGAMKGAVGGVPLTAARLTGSVPRGTTPSDIGVQPTNTAEQMGKTLEQGAEYAVPAGAVSKATAGLSLPLRMGAQGLTASGVGLAQGQTPKEAAITGGIAAGTTGIAAAISEIRARLPNTVSAGKKFDTILDAAKDVPEDTSQVQKAVSRSQELGQRGRPNPPKPIRDFIKDQKPTKVGPYTVAAEPMTYAKGFDFASAAKDISADQSLKLTVAQRAQLTAFGKAMDAANREAAAKVGMGDLFDSAMKEYAQAKSREAAIEVARKWAARAGLLAIGGDVVYSLFRAWNNR